MQLPGELGELLHAGSGGKRRTHDNLLYTSPGVRILGQKEGSNARPVSDSGVGGGLRPFRRLAAAPCRISRMEERA